MPREYSQAGVGYTKIEPFKQAMQATDTYTHRIGRTGRVDNNGDAFIFVTSEDAAIVHALAHVLNTKLERRTLQGFDYTVSTPNSEYMRYPRQLRRRTVRNQRIGTN